MTAINGPLSEAIGLAVLHLLWQGALVAGVLAVALRLLARSSAGVRYALSCGALAALVVFGVATAYRSYEPDSTAVLPPPAALETGPVLETGAAADPATLAIVAATLRMHSPNIALLWMMGVMILAARLAMSWTRTRDLARLDPPSAPGEWQPIVERLSTAFGIRRAVGLIESAAVDVPSVVGFLKPVVLVPASSLSGLSPRQLEMILAHELAHIRRHDYVVNMLQSVAETLLFFHPAAWWISRQIRIERENCCDDLAVAVCGNAIEYARALTQLEELRAGPSLALAVSGGSLLDRIRRLAGRGERKMVNGWTAVAAAVSFAVVMIVTSLPLRAERDAPDPPSPPAAEIDVVAAPEPPEAPRAVRSPAPARPPRAT
ncbi:MAG TPA: M56 family metallopeptidase, partial [Thermoanaerobaculia bacterium]|nr:M56 family metallopeptidase [Thermoanaerobaculia bacterium]